MKKEIVFPLSKISRIPIILAEISDENYMYTHTIGEKRELLRHNLCTSSKPQVEV